MSSRPGTEAGSSNENRAVQPDASDVHLAMDEIHQAVHGLLALQGTVARMASKAEKAGGPFPMAMHVLLRRVTNAVDVVNTLDMDVHEFVESLDGIGG